MSTLMEPGINLTSNSSSILPTLLPSSEKSMYREMIESLMYLSTMTHPDITYAISTLSQYLDSPHFTYLEAIKQNFQYLINTKHLQLVIGSNCLTDTNSTSRILGFSDADWPSQLHHHLISGFAFFVGVGTTSWSAKKQLIITLSSTKSEYVTLTHATKDILWIHKLLDKLTFLYNHQLPSQFYCDNQGAIELSKNSCFHAQKKHINVHFHVICQTVNCRHICVNYIPTDDMVTDIFTKPLARVKFKMFRNLFNIV